MRRRRAWPALALRRSPKVVVGLGVQGPSVLHHSQGETKAEVRRPSAPGPQDANNSQNTSAHMNQEPPAG